MAVQLGVMFSLLGFIGSYLSNFAWFWQIEHPKFLYLNGFIAFISFFGLISMLLKIANRYSISINQ